MRRTLFTAIALSLFLVGCYQGDSSQGDQAGFIVPLGEMDILLDEQVFERWKNWNPIEELGVVSWDAQEQSFFAGLIVSCWNSEFQEKSELPLQSLTWRSIGPVGAEVFVLEPVFYADTKVTGPCQASFVVRSLTNDGHGTMVLSGVAGFEKGAWESEFLQMEAEELMTGEVEIKGAGDAELRLRVSSYALAIKAESGAAGAQLYHSLPLGEELVLEQLGEPSEWTSLMTFVLSGEGERLTISLP